MLVLDNEELLLMKGKRDMLVIYLASYNPDTVYSTSLDLLADIGMTLGKIHAVFVLQMKPFHRFH